MAKGILRIKILGDAGGVDKTLDGFGKSLTTFGKAAGVAGAVAVTAFAAVGAKAVSTADNLQKLADKTGLSAERLQELSYIGDEVGVDLDTIAGAQAKLTKAMNAGRDGTGAQAKAFAALGISVTDANGNLRDAKTVMLEAFDALNGVGNETERDAIALGIFGKSAQELNPLIKAGADNLGTLAEKARESGSVMSNEAVAGLDKFGDALAHIKSSVLGAVGQTLAPLLESAVGPLSNLTAYAGKLAQHFADIAEKKGVLTALGDVFAEVVRKAGQWAEGIDWGAVGAKAAEAVTTAIAAAGPVAIDVIPKIAKSWVAGAADALFKAGQAIRTSQNYKAVEKALTLHPGIDFDQGIALLEKEARAGFPSLARGFTTSDFLKVKIERLELGFTDVTFDEDEIQTAIEGGYPADKIAALLADQQTKINEKMVKAGGKSFADMLFTPGEDLTKKYGDLIAQTDGVTTAQGKLAGALLKTEETVAPDLLEATSALRGLYEDIIAPTDAWSTAVEKTGTAADIAAGKYDAAVLAFDQYIVELQTKITDLDLFQTQVLAMAAEWAPTYGDALIRYAAEQGPEVMKYFMGLDDATQRKILDLWRQTMDPQMAVMGGDLATMSERMGEIAGSAAARGWVDKYGTGISGYLKELGGSLSAMYSGIGGAGATKHAEGGLITKPELGLVGEAGPELILPLRDQKRTQELLRRAGLARPFAEGGLVGTTGYRPLSGDTSLMRELIAAVRSGGKGDKDITINVSGNDGLSVSRQIVAALAGV